MNLPNIITMTRIALVPFFLFLMSLPSDMGEGVFSWRSAALIVFAAAAVTDRLDGWLARTLNQVTNFGKIIDPLADKLLVLAALVCFVREGTVAVWVVVTVLTREFIISSLRTVAAAEGSVLAADMSGKVKTAVQMVSVGVILTPWHGLEFMSVAIHTLASWIIAAVTVWSGADYLIRHRALFRTVLR